MNMNDNIVRNVPPLGSVESLARRLETKLSCRCIAYASGRIANCKNFEKSNRRLCQYSPTRRFCNFYERPLPASSRASAVLIG
jgi:hypothetical protein